MKKRKKSPAKRSKQTKLRRNFRRNRRNRKNPIQIPYYDIKPGTVFVEESHMSNSPVLFLKLRDQGAVNLGSFTYVKNAPKLFQKKEFEVIERAVKIDNGSVWAP